MDWFLAEFEADSGVSGVCSDWVMENEAALVEESGLHVSTKTKAFFFSLGALSMLASTFVFATIFSVKKLKAHPSNMIGYISVFEAISAFHTIIWICSTIEVIEYFGLEWLWNYTFVYESSSNPGPHCMTLC